MESKSVVTPLETRRFFEEKIRLRQQRLALRFARAQQDVATIVAMLIRDYAPRRIWQWGSLLRRDRFSDISDIDIAVEGIDRVELERIKAVHAVLVAEIFHRLARQIAKKIPQKPGRFHRGTMFKTLGWAR